LFYQSPAPGIFRREVTGSFAIVRTDRDFLMREEYPADWTMKEESLNDDNGN
jgi:hypothetical protein